MESNAQLSEFLYPYDSSIQHLTFALKDFVTSLVPEANELIWDNYNAVAIAYSKSEILKDAFCHIAVYSKHVNFGFNRGAELSNSKINLEGKGKLIRHIKVKDFDLFPKKEISLLVLEALGISEARNAELVHKKAVGKSIVMSISKKKVRPN